MGRQLGMKNLNSTSSPSSNFFENCRSCWVSQQLELASDYVYKLGEFLVLHAGRY